MIEGNREMIADAATDYRLITEGTDHHFEGSQFANLHEADVCWRVDPRAIGEGPVEGVIGRSNVVEEPNRDDTFAVEASVKQGQYTPAPASNSDGKWQVGEEIAAEATF
jgi:hypothetical protein